MMFFVAFICNVLIDRGKILEKTVKQIGISIAELARKTDYERTTVYRHFAKPDLEYAILLKYGKALKHDFTIQFPEMLDFISTVDEPISDYKITSLSEAMREIDHWKDKYIALLERHNELIMRTLNEK